MTSIYNTKEFLLKFFPEKYREISNYELLDDETRDELFEIYGMDFLSELVILSENRNRFKTPNVRVFLQFLEKYSVSLLDKFDPNWSFFIVLKK